MSDIEPTGDAWAAWRRLTAARIGLKRSGASLATGPLLEFQLAHARARDAVHEPLDAGTLAGDLSRLGMPVLTLASAVADRARYLMRPDLGRRLADGASKMFRPYIGRFDVAFVIADGLSAHAVQTHAAPLLAEALPRLAGWRIAPLTIALNGRVAIGDEIAMTLGADCVAVLIGERPGLSAPDSMGAYLTWKPGEHTTDAERNCISNIRPDGVGYADAAFKLVRLLHAMRARQISGVTLKDDSDRLAIGKST